jgi:hypothetical protein
MPKSSSDKDAISSLDRPSDSTPTRVGNNGKVVEAASDRIARLLWDHALHNVKTKRKKRRLG